ncbi:E3 ubiquitin-protein ligase SH3RF3-like [Babylonia areolata]|uniref:E3 ubiquitin-protein ligase SH3RF3-like n=1 Tax=Babylonia areolata TaxID=304850 RepID=UPI003FD260AE
MDEQALSELLECSVCLERLNHTSKVLPCQHTFCRRCLEEIVSTQLELRCPECRTLVTVRVEDLPPNILLVRLLEGLKTQGHSLSPKPSSYHRKRDTSADSRHQQSTRAGLDGPQPCARALYSYEASEKDDLSFKKGDLVTLRRQIDDNWYQGELNGQIGVFPASYVQVLVPLPQIPQCRALYDFQLDDENEKDCLTFRKDQVITVIRKVDTNWIEGRKGDKIGILPLAFVELNHAAKTLISSKPPSLVLHHGSRNSTATTTTTTTTTTSTSLPSTSTSAPPPSSQAPSSPAHAAVRQASRMSPHKRHSFTPKSDSPSPPPQTQRLSLELSSEGSGGVSTAVTASPLSLAPASATLMSTSMPAMPSGQERPLPSMSASVTENGASGDTTAVKGNASGTANSAASGSTSTPPPTVYMAMYNYRPQKDDEVELRKGDYYTVSEKCQDGWFKGQCLRSGVSGVFPGNYVQVVRQSSSFRQLNPNPNILNIRAKVPAADNHFSHHRSHHHAPARSLSDVGSSSNSNFSPPIPPHIKTSSPAAPPLLPRVARMSASSVSSSVTGRNSPLSSQSQSPKSISNTHVPVTITGGRSSRLPDSPRSGSTGMEPHHVHIGGGATGHASKHSTSPSSSGAKLAPGSADCHRRTASPHDGLIAVHHSMSTSSNITPPNVVMGPSESSSSPMAVIAKEKDKKEKKEKEKKGLVKLWPGKGKKSKSSTSETAPAHLADAVAHTRSGSFPSERNTPGSPRESSQHRKTASLDSSTSPLPKLRSKTQLRERYRCIVPYPPQTDHELELEIGDIVHVHKRREDGWYKGTQERTSKTGLFPGSFVEKCD